MPIHYINLRILKKFRGKTAVLRIDLNAPFRLDAVLPTLKILLKNENKIVVLSHYGRPRGREPRLSLRPFVPTLQRKLKQKVIFVREANEANKLIKLKANVFLLENLRFWKGEGSNDVKFAKKLSSLGDFYVNDAFAVSHRKNASVAAITRFLPSYGGLLLKKEIENLGGILKYTTRPFVVVIGGAKVRDKLGVIKYLWRKVDYFLLGSGPATTCFAAQGLPTGESFVDKNLIPKIKKFIGSGKLILPKDVKIKDKRILDIGPKTQDYYSEIISKAGTVVWNGPVGLFEKKEFSGGTRAIWKALFKNKKAKIVVGGGETLESSKLIKKNRVPSNVFLSTGGGAMLEYLSGKKLPGIEALKK